MKWFTLYQDASIWLAQQDLTGEQYHVLYVLFSKLDFDNYLRVSRQEIADFLNMQPTHVSRAMKKLKELKIIFEGPREGRFKTYRFNPNIAHKGSGRRNTIEDFDAFMKLKGQQTSDEDSQ